MRNGMLTQADFAWILGSLARLYRQPFDAHLVLQRFPPPHTGISLRLALQALGFNLTEQRVEANSLTDSNLPGVAFLNATADAGDPPVPPIPTLLIKSDNRRLLFFRSGSEQPETLPVEVFAERFEPVWYTVTPQPARPRPDGGDPEPDSDPRGRFGFAWFVPELLRHRRIWRDVLLASLAIQLIGLAMPLFTQVIIDKVVVHHTLSTLAVVGAGLALFTVFNALLSWLRQYLIIHTGNRIDAVFGAQVFSHLLGLPLSYFHHRPTGTLVARLHGVETVREFLSGALVTLILDLPFLLIFLGVMFFYSGRLSLIVLAFLALIASLSLLITPRFRARLDRQFLLGARNQAFVTEYLAGMETVKSLQMEAWLEQRYGEYLADYLGAGFATKHLANGYGVSANTLEQTLGLVVLVVGALQVMNGDGFTIGMLVAFQMFSSRLSQPVLRLVGLYQEFQQAHIALKRLGDLMDMPREPQALTPRRIGTVTGDIVIRSLSFRYGTGLPWLYHDFSLDIPSGRTVAIMGPSGSGKSTLAKLLQGFYQPTDGSIRLDGIDIRHLAANELRRNFGVVPQETVLFSGTIYDNLLIANPGSDFAQIVQACRMAEIHGAIEALPQGYQSEIGERGSGLSGGQKQRLAIARALLKRPRILVFDEATSNLDAQTAEHFATTINRLRGRVTMLFIAHQLPKTLAIDAVVRIGEGGHPSRMRDDKHA